MRTLILIAFLIVFTACKQKKVQENNAENENSKTIETMAKQEWEVLFDGSSFDGWHVYPNGEVPEAWKLEDGGMVLHTSEYRKDGQRYNLVTDREFTNFTLSLEWKVGAGANSGIMWSVVEDVNYPEPYYSGPEIQVLDNVNHPDAKNGTSHQAGALYDMVSPSKDVVKPIGEWNHCILTVNHKTNEGSVVLNGEKIVEFPVNGEAWDNMVANSKFATWEAFGKSKTGKIALQDHGEAIPIGYRNIKIKEL